MQFTIDSGGRSYTLNALRLGGTPVAAYADATRTTQLPLPITFRGQLSVYVTAQGVYDMDLRWRGKDIYPGTLSLAADSSMRVLDVRPSSQDIDLADEVAALPLPLKRFRQALATADSTPLLWLACGDSLTEGSGATKIDNGYLPRVRRRWQRDFTTAGKGGFGYLATHAKANPDLNGSTSGVNYWTFSGGGVGGTGQVALLGGRRYVPVANETATLTFTGTSFTLHHGQGSGTPAFTVAIDGGAATTVTPSTATTNRRGVWTSPTLTSGVHTAVITPAAGTILPIDGATLFDGDEGRGIRVLNNAQFGITSTSTVATNGIGHSTRLSDVMAVFPNPALVTINLGTNDPTNSISAATTAANLTTLIANIKAQCAITPSFVVMVPSNRAAVSTAVWVEYVEAITSVAAADPTNVAVLDLTAHLPDLPVAGNGYARGLVNTDGTHYTDGGYRFVASLLDRLCTGDLAPMA